MTQQQEAGVHLITHMWLSSDRWDQSVVKNTSHLTLVHFQYLLFSEPSKSTMFVCVCVCVLALLGLGGVWTLLMSSNLCSRSLSLSLFSLYPSPSHTLQILQPIFFSIHQPHPTSWSYTLMHFTSDRGSPLSLISSLTVLQYLWHNIWSNRNTKVSISSSPDIILPITLKLKRPNAPMMSKNAV